MARRILNVLTILSLVLCLAASMLWVRSHWAADRFRVFRVPRVVALVSVHGRVGVACRKVNQAALDVPVHADRRFRLDSGPAAETPFWADDWPDWNARGFQFVRADDTISWQWRLWVPLWFLVLALSLLPAASLMNRRRETYRKKHCRCPACGYDLRATPGRCPECGATS